MNKSSTWTALRNPAFRNLWIATVISGTCVAAHDNAATWMMNIFTESPFLKLKARTAAIGEISATAGRTQTLSVVRFLDDKIQVHNDSSASEAAPQTSERYPAA